MQTQGEAKPGRQSVIYALAGTRITTSARAAYGKTSYTLTETAPCPHGGISRRSLTTASQSARVFRLGANRSTSWLPFPLSTRAPLSAQWFSERSSMPKRSSSSTTGRRTTPRKLLPSREPMRSEEHTSELQSPCNLVCRLLLEKKHNNCPL